MATEFQIWRATPLNAPEQVSLCPASEVETQKRLGLIPPHASLFASFQANTPLDSMQKYHAAMGWPAYQPMLQQDGTPYPQDLQPFD